MTTQKENIAAPQIAGPKIVGKINLDALTPAKKQFNLFGNFPIKHYEAVVAFVKKTNKAMKLTDAFTVSKVAKKEGKELSDSGSIWFSTSKEIAFGDFKKSFNFMLVEAEHNCRRITKEDMLTMPFGQAFFMAYLFKDKNVKVSPCVKIYTTAKEVKKGINFTRLKDPNQNANILAFDAICDDGTFKADNAEGYLFVSNETFNNDL